MKEFVDVYVSYESPWEECHNAFTDRETQKDTRDTVRLCWYQATVTAYCYNKLMSEVFEL